MTRVPTPAEPASPPHNAAASAPDSVPSSRVAKRSLSRRFLNRPEVGSLMGAVAVFVLFMAIAEPFRSLDAFTTVLYASSTIGIMAVAVSLLMIGGEFDLSAGVGVVTSALAAAMFAFQFSTNVWIGVAVALALSLTIGFVNGLIVVKTKLPSFLVTLAMFMMLQGLNLAVTRAVTGSVSTQSIANMDGFGSAQAIFATNVSIGEFSVRITVLWWILFVALATWILLRTKVGNWIYAAGGNPDAARAVGVPVNFTKIGLFMSVGFMAWFVGMHQLFRFNTVQSGEGVGNELLFIAACVIGGCALMGGWGTAIGAAIGALIFGMTRMGIVFAGWNADLFMFFIGATLLVATVLNLWVRLRTARR
ncbi:ABC transporter permease [Haloechinothrix sp. LS1_15]|uniref:ABC transporter permease n=1 Tax=Haloechinothrix sp. LS1_15 TaxID=2652248 RepID=UPI002945FB8F|nr:ABC transporter permease [Haloechinothrix sp. LS1_15]MDV6012586.1 ABC transporter permease [Haloechinothrix sp. LS1_15]